MFAEERQLLIAALVATEGRVTVTDLAARFTITAETVRRDLDTLEAARQLRRVHGGAVAIDRLSLSEPSLDERQTQRLDEKSRIADAALRMIPASRTGSILLDSGSTTERLAERLAAWTPAVAGDQLLVITNAVPIAAKLSRNDAINLHILGGRVRGLTSAIVGAGTVAQLAALRPDIAFIGTNGISASFGLSTPDSVEAAVKSAIVRAARRVVVLADSSKLDQETLVSFAALAAIDTLITDATPSADLAAALAAADVDVVIA
ncbi:DeoR/GlpR transcriptional regulator [Cryobacterium sp. TMS1-20-1]|uniref:DeoR/GlpR family DNA-binding transcription regulator n=1 Tax=Cryobacterium sp. TMS1-20-1 TaxID=1259223 RepID=UPI00106C708A|nr:DeoR/GlpR family DNA-binding transcription regulator [Cryobacterium sp. TMS1-20-1]TFC80171.1 DeoR/GlpR transcriptional regulator [Cryobacterium sp. TMS1-20-1]